LPEQVYNLLRNFCRSRFATNAGKRNFHTTPTPTAKAVV